MDWSQILALILGNGALIIPLFLWNRAESRSDIRHMDTKVETFMNGIRQDIKAIHEEIKDFHSRLCEIEQRKLGKK